jgi:hypothetical protein
VFHVHAVVVVTFADRDQPESTILKQRVTFSQGVLEIFRVQSELHSVRDSYLETYTCASGTFLFACEEAIKKREEVLLLKEELQKREQDLKLKQETLEKQEKQLFKWVI